MDLFIRDIYLILNYKYFNCETQMEFKNIKQIDEDFLQNRGHHVLCPEAFKLIKKEAKKDLLNIYELKKFLEIKLNDKSVDILNKYIMWKFGIKDKDLK